MEETTQAGEAPAIQRMPEEAPVPVPEDSAAMPVAGLGSVTGSAVEGEDHPEAASPAVAEVQTPHPPGAERHRRSERGPDYVLPVVSPQERMAMAGEKHILDEPYERMKTEELKWILDRQRGPQTEMGWWCYVCLCGPQPGPQPDPNEEWPGRRKKVHRGKKSKKKRRRATKQPAKDIIAFEEAPAAANFRSEAVKALQQSSAGLTAESASALARNMGFIPSEADIASLKTQEPLDSDKFDKWIQCVAHTEDQDREALMAAFQVVDSAKSGTISEFAFVSILANFGEGVPISLSTNTAEELGVKAGAKIKYKEFVENLLASNRKLPPPEALGKLGIDVSKLPSSGLTEVSHFSALPSDMSPSSAELMEITDYDSLSSLEEEEDYDLSNTYSPIHTKLIPPMRRRPGVRTADFWARFR